MVFRMTGCGVPDPFGGKEKNTMAIPIIGAVVGVQPFGGSGLSGTGPKAGGPQYVHRYAVERVYTVNVAASGGNTDLFRLTTA